MRATTLLLTAALTLSSSAVFAQSSYNIVVEPVQPSIDAIINAPIEYDENGIMKAQYIDGDSLTDEQYQALLEEADRIRAYRDANGMDLESEYIYSGEITTYEGDTRTYTSSASTNPTYTASTYTGPTYTGPTYTGETYAAAAPTTVVEAAPSYQIDLFAPETSATSTYSTASTAQTHTVSKGETLYSISRLYDVSVPAIQAENGLSNTTLSIGQRVDIPNVIAQSLNTNTLSQPIFASAPTRDGYVTRRVVEPAPNTRVPVTRAPQFETVAANETVYAVLPKDTLYSISRRTCVGVKEIISRNAISNPNNLQPGQRITLPVGHCVSR